jgi:hypothetical protein
MFARDPFELDRKISAAARAWWRFRRELRVSDAKDHVFETASAFADRELFSELEEDLSPLSVPTRRWVYRLLEQRLHREAIVAVASAFRRETEPVLAPVQAELSPRDLLASALSDRARRGPFLEALARHSKKLRDRRLALFERRSALEERFAPKLEKLSLAPNRKLATFARDLLDRTKGALDALDARDLGSALEVSLAGAARASYPSHLSLRSLVELVDGARWFDSLALDPGELPARVAPASFARGLALLGASFRRAAASTSSAPFALSNDPFALPEHTFAALFAGLPLSPEFARRKLEVSRVALFDYQRAWARAALLGRALGFEIDPRLAGVLFAPRSDEPQRFAARLVAARLERDLVERHDEDWFRNPRAREELREQAREPVTLEIVDEALEAGVLEIERALSSALAR